MEKETSKAIQILGHHAGQEADNPQIGIQSDPRYIGRPEDMTAPSQHQRHWNTRHGHGELVKHRSAPTDTLELLQFLA